MLFVGRGVQLFYGLFLAQFIDLVDKILAITKDEAYHSNTNNVETCHGMSLLLKEKK